MIHGLVVHIIVAGVALTELEANGYVVHLDLN